MINFCNKFQSNYSDTTAPLRQLAKKNMPFIWTTALQAAFTKLKDQLKSAFTSTYMTDHKLLEKLLSPNVVKMLRVSKDGCCPYNLITTLSPMHQDIQTLQITCRETRPRQSPLQIALIHCDSIREEYINSILSQNILRSMTTNEIQEHSGKDQVLQRVIAAVKTKKWDKNQQPCYGIQDQPSVVENLLLKEH